MKKDKALPAIISCIEKRKIIWSYHVNMRLSERTIGRNVIIDSRENYEIIEEYSDDFPLPSYLIYSHYEGKIIHIVIAVDSLYKWITIVTAYYPNAEKWDKTFKKRKV